MKRDVVRTVPISVGALALCAGLCASALAGPTFVTSDWANAVSGDWGDGANWTTDPDFPNNDAFTEYHARILIGAGYTVTLDLDIEITDFTLGASGVSLDLTTNTMSVLRDASITNSNIVGQGIGSSGSFTVERDFTLNMAMLVGVPLLVTKGSLVFDGGGSNDICDSGIDHQGTLVVWQGGGDINFDLGATFDHGAGSSFLIVDGANFNGDGTGVFNNLGTIVKESGGAATTNFMGVELNNTGTLRVEGGTFATDGVDVNGAGNTLAGGSWRVLNGATLDLIGQQVFFNQADVSVVGAGSTFGAIDSIQVNELGARFEIATETTFTTQGDFTNNGELIIGADTTLRVAPTFTLTNLTGGALVGGEYEVFGAFQFDGASVATLDARLTLDGAAAAFLDENGDSALDALNLVGDDGAFTVRNGRDFITGAGAGDFTVATDGLLSIGAGTEFTVFTGNTLTNFAGGQFNDGEFDVAGTLRFDDAAIDTIDNRLTLDGTESLIVDQNDNDALSALSTIEKNGVLTLRNGRELDVLDDLVVRGQLVIESAPAPLHEGDPAPQTRITVKGDLDQTGGVVRLGGGALEVTGVYSIGDGARFEGGGSLLANIDLRGGLNVEGELVITGDVSVRPDGLVTVGVRGYDPGVDFDILTIDGVMRFLDAGEGDGGSFGTLRIVRDPDFAPLMGEMFAVIAWAGHDGEFENVIGRRIAPGVRFKAFYSDTGLTLVVVPSAPAAAPLTLGALLGCARRRRGG